MRTGTTRGAVGLAAGAVLIAVLAMGGGSVVPVGTYLYAKPADPQQYTGKLTVRFSSPGKQRLVVAYGRKFRKDRKSREGTSEADREQFKPWLGKLSADGSEATFPNLPADYYDIVVVDSERMTVHEGIALHREPDPGKATDAFLEEIRKCLDVRTDRIGGWEGFFDSKDFIRFETDGERAGVFLQQMRLGTALAESGATLKGCIHSIDVVWVERAKVEGAGWQVVTRQQLYRDEIPARTFFAAAFVPALQGVRVGTGPKTLGPVELPAAAERKKAAAGAGKPVESTDATKRPAP